MLQYCKPLQTSLGLNLGPEDVGYEETLDEDQNRHKAQDQRPLVRMCGPESGPFATLSSAQRCLAIAQLPLSSCSAPGGRQLSPMSQNGFW
jgi:hypothetical protein